MESAMNLYKDSEHGVDAGSVQALRVQRAPDYFHPLAARNVLHLAWVL